MPRSGMASLRYPLLIPALGEFRGKFEGMAVLLEKQAPATRGPYKKREAV
jgi:hypothetical protein